MVFPKDSLNFAKLREKRRAPEADALLYPYQKLLLAFHGGSTRYVDVTDGGVACISKL